MPVLLTGKCMIPLQSCHIHTHSTWEIILNLEGSGTDVVSDAEYPFYPGSIICVPPNKPHAKVSQAQFKDIFIQSTEFVVSDRQEVLCFQDDQEKSIEMLLQLAYRTFHQQEKNYLNVVDFLYDTIQSILLGRLVSPVKSQVIQQLTRIIVENFSDPEFEVSSVISSLPYCEDYVRRLFRKEMGTTPVSYLNGLRVEHAKKLLKQQSVTGYSVAEIALMCGFYDSRYFARLFRRNTKMSPSQYLDAASIHNSVTNLQ